MIKKIIDFWFRLKFWNRKRIIITRDMPEVVILYHIPKSQKIKYRNWKDGFTEGIKILKEDYNITWMNLADVQPTVEELNQYDFIIAKTGWYDRVDNYLRKLKNLRTPRGIVVSCSYPPYEDRTLFFYDVVWYQTFYSTQFIDKHPAIFHAYGGNIKDFKKLAWSKTEPKKYDVISIGILEPYKRFEKIVNFPGNSKLIIGNKNTQYYSENEDFFKENQIEVIDFVPQNEIPKYILKAKQLYIPAELNGGGERIIMEFKGCGIPIIIEDDNPKLEEILRGPNWDEISYGEGIRRGLSYYVNKNSPQKLNILYPRKNLKVGRYCCADGKLEIFGNGNVEIGSFCRIGKGTVIKTEHSIESDKPVIIGNGVIIEKDVVINPGVAIGDGVYIKAGMEVREDIPSFFLLDSSNKAPVPRFDMKTIETLSQTKWWLWSDRKIKSKKEYFEQYLNKEEFPIIL